MLPQYVGKDTFFHTNCGNNTTFDCTQRYKAAEFSISKRMSNRWQMQGSYVWSRLDGAQTGINTNGTAARTAYDFTNPNNMLDSVGQGRGANDQPHAFKLLGSYQAPWGINVGANFQSLSGLPIDRNLTVALAQGSRPIPVEQRGTYRAELPQPAVAARRQGRPLQRPPRLVRRSSCTTCSTRAPARAATAR